MPSRLFVLSALAASVAQVRGSIDWGSQESRDYMLSFDPATYGSGAAGALKFCTDFRDQCVDYVGALNYHHQIECDVKSTTSQVWTICAAVHKLPNGDYGDGTPLDFTTEVCPKTSGCAIVAQPPSPIEQYSAAADASAASAASVEGLTATGGSGEPAATSGATTTAAAASSSPAAATTASDTATSPAVPTTTTSSPISTPIPSSTTPATFVSLPISSDSDSSDMQSTTFSTVFASSSSSTSAPVSATQSLTTASNGAAGIKVGFGGALVAGLALFALL